MDYNNNYNQYGYQNPQNTGNNFASYGWDDEVEEADEYSLIAPGVYQFEVASFERGQFNGSEKVGPCNTVKVQFNVNVNGDTVPYTHNFFLNSMNNNRRMITGFFESIGEQPIMKPNGKKSVRMNWLSTPGRTGYFELTQNPDKKNPSTIYNNIKRFLSPSEMQNMQMQQPQPQPQPQAPQWSTGKF